MSKTEELLKKYPLPVKFPGLAGKHLLLVWWTHNEQNRALVTKSVAAMDKAFQAYLDSDRYSEAEPRRLYEVDIVSPPLKLQQKYARAKQEREKEIFGNWVGETCAGFDHDVKKWKKDPVPLPPGVTRCNEYRPDPEYFRGREVEEWDQERHSECLNQCWTGFCFDLERLYAEKRDKFLALSWLSEVGLRFPSRAPLAKPGRKLYELELSSGHHNDGNQLRLVKDVTYFDNTLFFCHAKELKVPQRYLDARKALDDKWKAEGDARQAEIRAGIEADHDRERERLKAALW